MRRGQGATEGADQPRGVKAHLMEAAPGRRAEARSHLHAHDVGGQQGLAARIEPRGKAQHGGQHRGGGMDNAGGVGVVVVEAVDLQRVLDDRVAQRQVLALADHGHVAAGAGEFTQAIERAAREVPLRGSQADAQRIEHQVRGACAHFVRYVGQAKAVHPGCDLCG